MTFPKALDPFRSIPAVVRAAGAAPGPLLAWWLGGLAAFFAVYIVVYVVTIAMIVGSGAAEDGELSVGLAVVAAVLWLAFIALMLVGQCWWRIGLLNVFAQVLRNGSATLKGTLRTHGRLAPCVGGLLLVTLIVLVLYLPAALGFVTVASVSKDADFAPVLLVAGFALGLVWLLGFLYVALGLLFVQQATILDGVGPLEAVRRSWRAASGHRLALLWLLLVCAVAALAGLLALCVGYLFTAAIVELSLAEAYLALTRPADHANWWISTGVRPAEPPPAWSDAQAQA
jgi:hypothetical protein